MGLTWGKAEMAALGRIGWRQRVHDPCGAMSKKRRKSRTVYPGQFKKFDFFLALKGMLL